MDDFIESDAVGINSQSDFDPGPSSPTPPSAQWQRESASRYRPARPVVLSSSVEAEASEKRATSHLHQPQESEDQPLDHWPLRMAAASAYSPMNKHARLDQGYVSDIAEADDSDDPDELDADVLHYAPFEIQVQSELDDQTWDEVPECEDVGVLQAVTAETNQRLIELGNTLTTDKYFLLIDYAIRSESENGTNVGKFLYNEEQDFWRAMALPTLCSMPQRAIRELMSGNLKQAYDSDPELRAMLDLFADRGRQHPCIYARILTAPDGTPMTAAESRRLALWLQRYVSDVPAVTEHPSCKEAFSRMDKQFRGQWKRVNPSAERAYLASNKSARLQCRVDNVKKFCQALITRCEVSEREGTLLKPLTYIGYAVRAEHRKRQHEACGKSSNWLATLVQAVCNVIWGQSRFQMHFMVVCLLQCDTQDMTAEMILTRISGAYYNTGGGFCIDIAGKSCESAYFHDLTSKESNDRWNELHEWVVNHTPLEATREECVSRMRKSLAEIAAAKSEISNKLVEHQVRARLQRALLASYRDVVDSENPELAQKIADYSKWVEEVTEKAAPLFESRRQQKRIDINFTASCH